jgi:Ca-activated chloride channel family protein
MIRTLLAALVLGSFAALASAAQQQPAAPEKPVIPGGELQILGKDGKPKAYCPLKHTDVTADVAGFIARVKVKQIFHNPSDEKVEAVYVFPLGQDGAVDEMTMTVGDRRVVGQIKKREEARAVYEQARAAGHVATLLDQERPNIFTQSVANLEPGAEVTIEIAYNETLKYEDGFFEFSFPTVVAPRYMGSSAGRAGQPDAVVVPDADRISPPLTPKNTRAGHDIGITVNLDAGMEIQEVDSRSHPVNVERPGPTKATVALKKMDSLPNKDFILRYRTATEQVGDAFLVHKDERGWFFTLVLQPPRRVERKQAVGRELIFVLDTSGSMQGLPITQAKWVMGKAIDGMGPQDTFNLITFSGDTHVLWDAPRPASEENRQLAQQFLEAQRGSGGTEMMKAINAALKKQQPAEKKDGPPPIRVVCFMTDGEVGNDFDIINAVKENAGTTRVFSFGIGNSINRFLLDQIAYAGRGEVQYVPLSDQPGPAAKKFYERIDAPVLTDMSIDWGGLPVADTYPTAYPDLWSAKPLVIKGRLKGDVKDLKGQITLKGNTAAGPFERKVDLKPAAADASHQALASLWALARVQDLMMQDLPGMQRGEFKQELKDQMTALGIEFRLLTQFTSFVAVEEVTITKGGQPRKVMVPVDLPDGMSYEGLTGEKDGPQAEVAMLARRGGAMRGTVVRQQMLQKAQQASLRVTNGADGATAQFQEAEQLSEAKAVGQGSGGPGSSAGGSRPKGLETAAAFKRPAAPATQPAGGVVLSDGDPAPDAAHTVLPDPAAKLDRALVGLAEKVAKEGKDGTLKVGDLSVTAHQLDVILTLSNTSKETLEALKKLGFTETGASKAGRMLFGSIDVRKLDELAKLPVVLRVRPMAG